ncbi:hypothetical protein LTR35_017226 [Friedmanniomyces endolithicus]|nr:hypothetical protein LTR35_017226 [Friedmanniomyces endolithicus]KAK0269541.1 hypothetical protein LTS00_017256 [Friedmanniomyces endolithicus]KAK0973099.1 hypothetical protein LTR54_017421 [Friedmanniomyces endolithicus]
MLSNAVSERPNARECLQDPWFTTSERAKSTQETAENEAGTNPDADTDSGSLSDTEVNTDADTETDTADTESGNLPDTEVNTEAATEADTENEDDLYAARSPTARNRDAVNTISIAGGTVNDGLASTQVNLGHDGAPTSMNADARADQREADVILEVSGGAVSTESYVLSDGVADMFDFDLFEYDINIPSASIFLNPNRLAGGEHFGKRADLPTPSVFNEPMTSFDGRLLQAIAEETDNHYVASR